MCLNPCIFFKDINPLFRYTINNGGTVCNYYSLLEFNLHIIFVRNKCVYVVTIGFIYVYFPRFLAHRLRKQRCFFFLICVAKEYVDLGEKDMNDILCIF